MQFIELGLDFHQNIEGQGHMVSNAVQFKVYFCFVYLLKVLQLSYLCSNLSVYLFINHFTIYKFDPLC